jgi:hypothetical protein
MLAGGGIELLPLAVVLGDDERHPPILSRLRHQLLSF